MRAFGIAAAIAMGIAGPAAAQQALLPPAEPPLMICAGDAIMLRVLFNNLPEAGGENVAARAEILGQLRAVFSVTHGEDMNCSVNETEIDDMVQVVAERSFADLQSRIEAGEDILVVVDDYWNRVDACVGTIGMERVRSIMANAQAGDPPCGWQ